MSEWQGIEKAFAEVNRKLEELTEQRSKTERDKIRQEVYRLKAVIDERNARIVELEGRPTLADGASDALVERVEQALVGQDNRAMSWKDMARAALAAILRPVEVTDEELISAFNKASGWETPKDSGFVAGLRAILALGNGLPQSDAEKRAESRVAELQADVDLQTQRADDAERKLRVNKHKVHELVETIIPFYWDRVPGTELEQRGIEAVKALGLEVID